MSLKPFVTLFLSALIVFQASAGGLEISPLRVDLSANQKIQSINLRNISQEEVLVSIKVFKWTQKNNKNIYTPTKDLIVTPPIITVAENSQQVVRLAKRKSNTSEEEQAYRLYAEQVIPKAALKNNRLNFALRLGIPIFIQPKNETNPAINWELKQLNNKTLKVIATNIGNKHVVVNKLELAPQVPTNWHIDKDIFNYILPNSSHYWTFSLDKNFDKKKHLKLTANTSVGQLTTTSSFKTS